MRAPRRHVSVPVPGSNSPPHEGDSPGPDKVPPSPDPRSVRPSNRQPMVDVHVDPNGDHLDRVDYSRIPPRSEGRRAPVALLPRGLDDAPDYVANQG